MSPASHHPIRARLIWLRRRCLRVLHWHSRALIWLAAVLMLVWGGAAAWLQWWLFPHLEAYRPRLVAELGQRSGRPVSIGKLQGGWQAGQPYIDFLDLALKHPDGRPALSLSRAQAQLSWWPLLLGELRFASLTAISPDLEITRDEGGTVRLADLPLTRKGEADAGFGNWLLRQHAIAIVDGRLTWRDQQRKAPPLVLEHVSFSLENQLFGRHAVSLQVAPPSQLAAPFSLVGSWRGDDLADFAHWTGSLQTALSDVDVAAWGAWVPFPIEVRRGRGQLDLAMSFRGLAVQAADATLDLHGAAIKLAPELDYLVLQRLAGSVRWRDADGARTLQLGKLHLTADGGKLLDGSSALLTLGKTGGGTLAADGLTLTALANVPRAVPLPNAMRHWLAGMRPSGRVDHLEAGWTGDWREPASYHGRVAFSGIGLAAPAPWPSTGPLDGELTMSDKDGQLTVTSRRFHLADSELFEKPMQFDQFRLAADWRRDGKLWIVRLNDFAAENGDITAGAKGGWRWAGEGSGTLALDATIARLTANKVADYLPNAIGKETRDWLRGALTAGEARHARLMVNGPLDQFPFADGKSGIWKVETETHGVTLDYAPGWPAMVGIEGDLKIEGDRLSIGAKGHILNAEVEQAEALIPSLSHADAVHIDGNVVSPTAELFRFIAQSPLDKTLGGLGSAAKASGDGKLALKLDIPFSHADETRVDGHFRFAHNRLQLHEAMPEVRELAGDLHFDEHGADARALAGQVLGGAVKIDVAPGKDGAMLVSASGRADARLAAQRYGVPMADALSGATDYELRINMPASGFQLALDAPMREVKVDLPAPLGKAAGEIRPLRLGLEATASSERWRVGFGNQLTSVLYRSPGSAGWRIDRGELHVGEGTATASRLGVWLTTNLPALNADAWLARLASGGGSPATDATAGIGQLAGVDARIGKLQIGGSRIDDLNLQAQQADGSWQWSAASQQIEGRGSWATQGKPRLYARLARLALPLPDADAPASASNAAGKRKFPVVDLAAEDFRLSDHALGRLELKAQPGKDSWVIDDLTLINPDGNLGMQGTWATPLAEDRTNVKVDVESSDIGKLLGRFGYGEVLRRGRGSLHGDLSWRGSPLAPEYANLSGNFEISADAGQFAKGDPGVGRLLGVLSLQSIPRRLSLDFHDIFSEGFAFDHIEGDSKVVNGVLSTSNLSIVGPAAKVQFRGEADLAAETQNLRVRIIPTVGDSLAVGAGVALANPVVGVGAYVLQRVLKDPLGRLVAYEYDITGPWADPQVVRVGSTPPKPASR
jgi:uncharacterized protein (TIGR02099 family)